MKILFVLNVKLSRNGISTFVRNSAMVLSNKGDDITILAPNNVENKIKMDIKAKGIKLIELPNRKTNSIKFYYKLLKIIKSNKFDVVHVNGNSCSMALDLFCAKIAGIKVRVAHSHNSKTSHALIHRIMRPIFELSVTDRFACNNLSGRWLFHKKKFNVINNGVLLKKYTPSLCARKSIREKLGISKNDIVLGNVGLFNYQKNQEFLVYLEEMLKMDSYRLILVGNGENFDSIKRMIIEKDLLKKVFLPGSVDNVNDYLSAMDIFLMPSRFEGLPYALVEAQASGLTCIASSNIDKEVDITKSISFCDIKFIQSWKDSITGLNKFDTNDFKKREKKANIYQKILNENNYDFESNIINMRKLYQASLNR